MRLDFGVFLVVFLCFSGLGMVSGSRVLAIFHMPSKSHHMLSSRLCKAIAQKGHQVTVVSPYPLSKPFPNYTDVVLDEMIEFIEADGEHLVKHDGNSDTKSSLDNWKFVKMFESVNDILLSSPKVQKLKTQKFDLIIQFGIFADSVLGFSHHFQAPVIVVSTVGPINGHNDILGNPQPLSHIPYVPIFPTQKLTFLDRLKNVLSFVGTNILKEFILNPTQEKLLKKHFPGSPGIQELKKNVALIFVNSHYSFETPRAYVPNMIPIGGLHVDEPKTLPQELQKYLDSATQGAIYFSLGSNVRLSEFPPEKLAAIINSLGKTGLKVLLKTDMEIPDLPQNIKIGQWMPQNDILAHPNLKLFISHGGLLSTIEAIYHGVPILGIPIYRDQPVNVADAVAKGYATSVAPSELTEEHLLETIRETLGNPSYRENIRSRSSLMKNQPLKPLETAVFWVEHVLQHRGADHLKNPGVDVPLYQYLLLDVISVLILIFVLTCAIFWFSVKVIYRKIRARIWKSDRNKKNQ